MFPPCELFLFIIFFFFYMGILQPTALKAGKLWFSPQLAKHLYSRLNYRVGRSRGLFARTGHAFYKICPFSFSVNFSLFIYRIAFPRIYFTLGGLDGPDKDQIFEAYR